MRVGASVLGRATAIGAVVMLATAATPAAAQVGTGDGFWFRVPKASMTFHGGFAQPVASGGVFELATSELTLGRGDFSTGNVGFDFTASVTPRFELMFGIDDARSSARSEYRDWTDNNNLPIEQKTSFNRTAITGNLRYFLAERGRRVGSVAWIPARIVPFVSVGGGYVKYHFAQVGDFVDTQTLAIFTDRLSVGAWRPVVQAGAGAQWSLNQRFSLTGELRYIHGTGPGDVNGGAFSGYKVNLSGVSSSIGLTIRL